MLPSHLRPPRDPDFNQLLAVLANRRPDRPTLFEFIVDPKVILPARDLLPDDDALINRPLNWMRAMYVSGYDFAAVPPWFSGMMQFPSGERQQGASVSQNEGGVISDRASFEAYPWPDPDRLDYGIVERLACELPDGMKLIGMGWGGVLENVTDLLGFENLCFMLMDDPELLADVFSAVGSRLLGHYETLLRYNAIGACVVNDDWGFRTQTTISPAHLREYVFPWHRRIVETIHAAGRPAILHSCGQLAAVWDDLIDDLRFDAKHSFEDAIMPVEEVYRTYGPRIAILGGLDVDFLCRSQPEEIERRGRALLELASARGGYALGTGNSIAPYIPAASFQAIRRAVFGDKA